jgi:hypothetical protein
MGMKTRFGIKLGPGEEKRLDPTAQPATSKTKNCLTAGRRQKP